MWEWLGGDKGQLLIAGVAGAAVSAVMDWSSWWGAARRMFVGSLTAFFMGPAGIPVFEWVFGKVNIPVEQSTSVGGFIMGVGGIVIVEIIMKTLKGRRDQGASNV